MARRGIGFALAKRLIAVGFEVVLACRNQQRGSAARDAILAEFGQDASVSSRLHLILVDVASLKSVAAFCKAFQAQ